MQYICVKLYLAPWSLWTFPWQYPLSVPSRGKRTAECLLPLPFSTQAYITSWEDIKRINRRFCWGNNVSLCRETGSTRELGTERLLRATWPCFCFFLQKKVWFENQQVLFLSLPLLPPCVSPLTISQEGGISVSLTEFRHSCFLSISVLLSENCKEHSNAY